MNSPLTREEMISCLNTNFVEYWDKQWKFNVEATGKGLDLYRIRNGIRQNVPVYKLKNKLHEKAIYRLRLGHVGVRKYLCRIKLADSGICECCNDQVEETIEHYLLQCSAFNRQRRAMYSSLQNLNIREINLKILLGGVKTMLCLQEIYWQY